MRRIAVALLVGALPACHLLLGYSSTAGAPDTDGAAPDRGAASDGAAPTADRGASDARAALTARAWAKVAAAGPGPLWMPAMVYVPEDRAVVLYGGNRQGWLTAAAASAAMWRYRDGRWSEICDPCAPGARSMHGMVHDAARGRLVLFGGHTERSLDDRPAELWEWTPAGGWVRATPTGTPPAARVGHAMAFDAARGRTVLFGGETSAGMTDELFEHDGARWIQRPKQGAWPTARVASCGATFDATRRATLIYGGPRYLLDPSAAEDDLWAWDGAQWQQLCAACTGQARSSAPLRHDPTRDRVLLVGGFHGSGELAGTWELDGSQWHVVDPDAPTARDSMGLAFDSDRDVFVLYGGNGFGCEVDAAGNCDETLEYRRVP